MLFVIPIFALLENLNCEVLSFADLVPEKDCASYSRLKSQEYDVYYRSSILTSSKFDNAKIRIVVWRPLMESGGAFNGLIIDVESDGELVSREFNQYIFGAQCIWSYVLFDGIYMCIGDSNPNTGSHFVRLFRLNTKFTFENGGIYVSPANLEHNNLIRDFRGEPSSYE